MAGLMARGPLITRGKTAEIFAWQGGRVLKLLNTGLPDSWAELEAKHTRYARDAGLPVPSVIDTVEVDGRQGIVYERIEGMSMESRVKARPLTLVASARKLAELHVQVHACAAPEFPSQRLILTAEIKAAGLPEKVAEAALAALHRLPNDDAMCHNDFHLSNMIMSPRGAIIIDWLRATRGNPLADVAKALLLLGFGDGGPLRSGFGRLAVKTASSIFRYAYLRRYFQLRPCSRGLVEAWQLPIVAARISRGYEGEKVRLLRLVETLLPRNAQGFLQ